MSVEKAKLEFQLFGPLDVRLNGQPLPGLGEHRRAAHLLAFIALNGPRVLKREWITEQLSDTDAGGNRIEFTADNYRQQSRLLREILGESAPVLVTGHGTLSLVGDDIFVDTQAFDTLWEARQTDPRGLAQIPPLYQGPLLQDWNQGWVRTKRDEYARKYLRCLQALARQAEADGDMEAAIDYLAQAVEADPVLQLAQIHLIQTLIRAGEHPKAKQAFDRYASLLEEQGMAVPQEMLALYEQIPRPVPGAMPTFSIPASDIEPVGGAVPIRSRYYIVRPADEECHAAIARRDSFVLLHGSRQVGKTSILARGLEQARRMGAQVLHTDFQKFSEGEMASLDAFFLSLALRLAKSLKLPASPHDSWDSYLTPGMNFEQYFLENVLERAAGPVVWGMDEVDRLFPRDYRGDVFSLFRSWHNERALNPDTPLKRLTILLSYAVEANHFIPNLNQSPFNVGTSISLNDFSSSQVEELCSLHDLALEEAVPLFGLTCGHPYLTRSALYARKTRGTDLGSIAAMAVREEGPFSGHLRHLRKTLSENERLGSVVKGVLKGEPCSNRDDYYHLTAAGILKGDAQDALCFRCPLYETYLRKNLL